MIKFNKQEIVASLASLKNVFSSEQLHMLQQGEGVEVPLRLSDLGVPVYTLDESEWSEGVDVEFFQFVSNDYYCEEGVHFDGQKYKTFAELTHSLSLEKFRVVYDSEKQLCDLIPAAGYNARTCLFKIPGLVVVHKKVYADVYFVQSHGIMMGIQTRANFFRKCYDSRNLEGFIPAEYPVDVFEGCDAINDYPDRIVDGFVDLRKEFVDLIEKSDHPVFYQQEDGGIVCGKRTWRGLEDLIQDKQLTPLCAYEVRVGHVSTSQHLNWTVNIHHQLGFFPAESEKSGMYEIPGFYVDKERIYWGALVVTEDDLVHYRSYNELDVHDPVKVEPEIVSRLEYYSLYVNLHSDM